MGDYVEKYKCGSCKEYEYEGKLKKGRCNRYKAYYYPDDSCRHWEQSDNVSSVSNSSCYLTTACVEYKNLPDDCIELTTLRMFRDEYMNSFEEGRHDVREYYDTAPQIVESINMSGNAAEEYNLIYEEVILPCVEYIQNGDNDKAYKSYKDMVRRLGKKYKVN